jgi:hypothetical protein
MGLTPHNLQQMATAGITTGSISLVCLLIMITSLIFFERKKHSFKAQLALGIAVSSK